MTDCRTCQIPMALTNEDKPKHGRPPRGLQDTAIPIELFGELNKASICKPDYNKLLTSYIYSSSVVTSKPYPLEVEDFSQAQNYTPQIRLHRELILYEDYEYSKCTTLLTSIYLNSTVLDHSLVEASHSLDVSPSVYLNSIVVNRTYSESSKCDGVSLGLHLHAEVVKNTAYEQSKSVDLVVGVYLGV